MANRGRRYDDEPKLNIKKVIAVALIFLIFILLIVGIKKLLDKDSNSITGKIENVYYYTIYDNGKWGVINSYGEIIVKATYDEMIVIPDESQDIFICTYDVDYSNGTYKTKAINSKGKEIVKDYDKVEAVANHDEDKNIWYEKNVFKVQKNDKYGLINYSGKSLLECEYDEIEPIYGIENSLVIKKDGKYGLCDDSGNIIIDTKYKAIGKIEDDYKNGYVVVSENDKYGIIGIDKSVILETKYDEVKSVCGENIYTIKENGKYYIINKAGDKILSKGFEDVLEINKDYIVIKNNGKCGVVDIHGETKLTPKYNSLTYKSGDDYIAKTGDKFGIINLDGTSKIAEEYVDIKYIGAGNFVVANYEENGKIFSKVYDSNYELKITGEILEINTSKGYIRVRQNDEYKYYNFKFEEKVASQIFTNNALFLSKKDGKYGFIDNTGKVIVNYIYDDATEQNSSGYAGIKKDGLWGSINLNGKVVIEPTYNLDSNKKIDFIGTWHLCEDTNANYYLDV